MYMLTLASYLDERAAKLKREALGRCQVAFAGSPPNSLHYILDQFFGFKEDTASEASGTDPLQSFTRLLTEEPVRAAPNHSWLQPRQQLPGCLPNKLLLKQLQLYPNTYAPDPKLKRAP